MYDQVALISCFWSWQNHLQLDALFLGQIKGQGMHEKYLISTGRYIHALLVCILIN